MTFRTTCPQCVSVFRLGADQFGAAQGWVQCSVCGAAFDARPSLLMEDGSPLPPVEPEFVAVAPRPQATPAAAHETHEAVPVAAAEASPNEAASNVEETTVADIPGCGDLAQCVGIAQRETSLDLPSIILIDPDIPLSDDPGPLPQIYPAPAYPSAPTAVTAPTQPAAHIEYAVPMPGTARIPSAPRRIKPWVWAMASVLLTLLLLAQTTYFLRDSLVSRLPQTRPAFEQACAALGCTLSLSKNLAHLQIIGSDLQTETRGRLKLILTLGNRADQAQAWPVLLLTLTDQRNRPLARRSFAPSEYLGDAQRIAAGIPPRSEQPLSLPLTVRDLAPMGFDLQLSY